MLDDSPRADGARTVFAASTCVFGLTGVLDLITVRDDQGHHVGR